MRLESREELLKRIQELERRLAESEETLDALRSGEVDAIEASGPDGDQIYTLKGADEAYRQIVEDMTEGALTLARDGLILFSNERFASLVATRLEQVIGSYLQDLMSCGAWLAGAAAGKGRGAA
jgi:PAS domain-containing protein